MRFISAFSLLIAQGAAEHFGFFGCPDKPTPAISSGIDKTLASSGFGGAFKASTMTLEICKNTFVYADTDTSGKAETWYIENEYWSWIDSFSGTQKKATWIWNDNGSSSGTAFWGLFNSEQIVYVKAPVDDAYSNIQSG